MTPAISWLYIPPIIGVVAALVWLAVILVLRTRQQLLDRRLQALVDAGRIEDAAVLLQEAGRTTDAARLLADHGRHSSAADLLRQAGDFVSAARFCLDAGDLARAAELFQRGGDLTAAAGCYVSAGRIDEAMHLFRRTGDLSTAARLLERAGQHKLALDLYLEVGDVERTAALAMDRVTDRAELGRLAARLADRGEHQLALRLYVKGGHQREVGLLAERFGFFDQALDAFLKQDYFEDAARVCAARGNHRDAAQLYLKAGRLEDAAGQLLAHGDPLAVARLFRRVGAHDRALQVLDQVPQSSAAFRNALLLKTSLLAENHRLDAAANTLKQLLEVVGYITDNVELVYRLVDLQLQLGLAAEAIASLERAKRSGLSDPRIDEQLMLLRQSPHGLLEPEEDLAKTVPADFRGRGRMRGSSTTLGFPRSDRYALKRKLARGGHGVLFLVEDRKLGREVVLKLLHSETLPSEVARKYFMREARTAAALDHPNIVKVHDFGELEGRPYIAMEYVDGLNLMELYENTGGALPFERICSIGMQLCEALAYAHTHSIIHRDVKMENVMVSSLWQVKLMDFGLAKALDENPDRSLFIIGTPFYMSPEQIVGEPLDNRTDIYSLGVLLFRLFTGRLPFEEGEVLSHHRNTPAPDPRGIRPGINAPIAEMVLKCLAKNRNARYGSAQEIAAVLEAARREG
ncbi:MAG: hypothetical protein FJ109_08685 [Deltaproteobacteria bacterium]|nr:hypothetical protein [Deltaproteobacteria bacterium]